MAATLVDGVGAGVRRCRRRADQRPAACWRTSGMPNVADRFCSVSTWSSSPAATTLPSRSSSAWLNPGGISSTWWETSTVAGESGSMASTLSVETRSSRPPRSSPAAGSSSSSSSGSVISARAICTRLRSPSLRVPKVRSASWLDAQLLEQARRRGRGRGRRTARASGPPRRTTPRRPRPGPVSPRGIRSARAALVRPIRGRSSKTSTVPSTSSRIPATPSVGWIWAEATWSSVVLPAPLGPRITQRSSSSTVQSMLSSRVARPRRTVTPANSRTAAMAATLCRG